MQGTLVSLQEAEVKERGNRRGPGNGVREHQTCNFHSSRGASRVDHSLTTRRQTKPFDLQLYLELSPREARATGDRSAQWQGRILVTPGPLGPPGGGGRVSILSLQANGRTPSSGRNDKLGLSCLQGLPSGDGAVESGEGLRDRAGQQQGAGPIGSLPPATAGTPVGGAVEAAVPWLWEGPLVASGPKGRCWKEEWWALGQGLCAGTRGRSLRLNVGGTMSLCLRGGETRSFLHCPIHSPSLDAVWSSGSFQLKTIERRGRVPHQKTRERSVRSGNRWRSQQ